jgi:hypothetical protein
MKTILIVLTFLALVAFSVVVSPAYGQDSAKAKALLLKAQETAKAGKLQEADKLLIEAGTKADTETFKQILDERLKIKKAMRDAKLKAPDKTVDEPLTKEQRTKILKDIESRPASRGKELQDSVQVESVKRTQQNHMPRDTNALSPI